jgi:hypothetical protein
MLQGCYHEGDQGKDVIGSTTVLTTGFLVGCGVKGFIVVEVVGNRKGN